MFGSALIMVEYCVPSRLVMSGVPGRGAAHGPNGPCGDPHDVAPTTRLAREGGTGVPPVIGHGRDGHGTSLEC